MSDLRVEDDHALTTTNVRKLRNVQHMTKQGSAVLRYAMISRDRKLVTQAVNKKFDAERKGGGILKKMAETGERLKGRAKKKSVDIDTLSQASEKLSLSQIGISRRDSSRWQKFAKMTVGEFNKKKAAAIDAAVSFWEKIKEPADRGAYEQRVAAAEGTHEGNLQTLIDAQKTFSVIYADPPWTFETYSEEGKGRSAERHYDTMSLDGIKAMPVAKLAAQDCVLLMWAVCPQLPEALEVIREWGFDFKTVAFTWVKQNKNGNGLFVGMGYWTRANAELCLLATRGSPKRVAKNVHQIIMSPVRKHSEKPELAAKGAMKLLNGPYLELFARAPREGWNTWGNEIA
jgi:N6-adenosine-specific RNA methylase IME4